MPQQSRFTPPALPGTLSLLMLGCISWSADAQQGIPATPPYPVTWQMNRSTIIMPCNETGLTDPRSTKGWGIVDFDWSNAKAVWAKAKPMNCEEMLVEQVKKTTEASPGTTVWVYRNAIKALPWYTTVRVKLTDPAYSPWFMKFSDAVIANHSAAHIPVCDSNYNPPRCSNLYHDQDQTPGYPKGDGVCLPPGCDVGSVPIGEYLFDPRAANVSVNGETFIHWFVEEYLFSQSGAGNPNISGFYFDDDWSMGGPSEVNGGSVEDMGLGKGDLANLTSAFNWVMKTAYDAILARDKFTWNQFWNYGSHWIDCPDPMVTQKNCAADIRSLCNETSESQKYAMLYAFAPGCHGSTSNITNPVQDIANFLLVRGPHAWLGHGWSGCSRVYEWPKELDADYGEPLGLCKETAPNSGVFTREWTKATVQTDCSTYTSSITMK